MKNKKLQSFGNQPPRYLFAINSYKHEKISKCPACNHQTFKRKFPLVILLKPRTPILSLGLTCKYCAKCEFIIAHQHELEHELCIAYEKIDPSRVGDDYFVIGTMDKKLWKKNLNNTSSSCDVFDLTADFKEYLTIQVEPGGWFRDNPL